MEKRRTSGFSLKLKYVFPIFIYYSEFSLTGGERLQQQQQNNSLLVRNQHYITSKLILANCLVSNVLVADSTSRCESVAHTTKSLISFIPGKNVGLQHYHTNNLGFSCLGCIHNRLNKGVPQQINYVRSNIHNENIKATTFLYA